MTASPQTNLSHAPEITPNIVAEHGLSQDEYKAMLSILGRQPSWTELGIFSVMWSEHCSYKSTRLHLKNLPTKADWVVCGPGENAGVIDIGDNQVAIFKMESHNHPSFIEPYQGAATGVGGIMRDIFTMGARPIANLNALRFGEISHPKTKYLLSGVVAGIGGYGNSVGIPTVGGECIFHSSYNGNILVNAMCVGIASKNKVFYSKATVPGSKVMYVGSKTGRDGIHGATMASASFDETVEQNRPAVQVGDPFTEKLLLEACLELMSSDAILSIQDMGAAGLTCCSLEMAGKGGTGINLYIDQVPVREKGMTPYEIMLSESQERMLIVLKPDKVEEAAAIFLKWELDAAVVGEITDSGRLKVFNHGEIMADIPIEPLHDKAPVYDRPYNAPQPQPVLDTTLLNLDLTIKDINNALLKLLACPDLCSKRWIYEQYDSTIGASSIAGPGGDAGVVRVNADGKKALALSSDCTPRYCAADPYEGAKQAVAENWRNLISVGSKPLAITDCLNFGNPEKPEIMGQIVSCIKGIKDACEQLVFPVVSGNVSLYNETNDISIQPTPTIGGVGIIADIDDVVKNHFTKENEAIIVIGNTIGHLGASLFLREIFGQEAGAPPPVDLVNEKKTGEFIFGLIQNQQITTCHDIADGGLYTAIAEMAIPACIGAKLAINNLNISLAAFLFGEDQGRYIITCDSNSIDIITNAAKALNIPADLIGYTGGKSLSLNGDVLDINVITAAREKTIPALMID